MPSSNQSRRSRGSTIGRRQMLQMAGAGFVGLTLGDQTQTAEPSAGKEQPAAVSRRLTAAGGDTPLPPLNRKNTVQL